MNSLRVGPFNQPGLALTTEAISPWLCWYAAARVLTSSATNSKTEPDLTRSAASNGKALRR